MKTSATGPLRTLFGCLQFLLLVLGGLVLAAFMALGRRRRPDLSARSPFDFLCGSERLLLSWTHPGPPGSVLSQKYADKVFPFRIAVP